jgi:hypothetical protein
MARVVSCRSSSKNRSTGEVAASSIDDNSEVMPPLGTSVFRRSGFGGITS